MACFLDKVAIYLMVWTGINNNNKFPNNNKNMSIIWTKTIILKLYKCKYKYNHNPLKINIIIPQWLNINL